MTVLHSAAAGGDPKIVQVLLEAGADAGAVDGNGRRPIDLAKLNSYASCVHVLSCWMEGTKLSKA
jgi:ankyrin repeat protein